MTPERLRSLDTRSLRLWVDVLEVARPADLKAALVVTLERLEALENLVERLSQVTRIGTN